VILDLDGVVYIGAEAVPYAIDELNHLASNGTVLAAATNNASRPVSVVAEHLHSLGLRIEANCVMTSAQAAGRHLATLLSPGTQVLAVGGEGVSRAIADVSLVPLRASEDLEASSAAADRVAAVLVGYGPRVAWFDLATAHWAIERGKPWFATNTDPTVPLPYGRAPGNGAMVGLLRTSTGVEPTVIGKPQPALFGALAAQLGTRDVLVIGDRLDTDIDGAIAADMDSLLVLTGVHGLHELAERSTTRWPTYVAQDLRSLRSPAARVWRSGSQVLSDMQHPLVDAILAAAAGTSAPRPWSTAAASPLIDLRGLR
jgi:HAD superfamily hydrolase (TIGR01450 family)